MKLAEIRELNQDELNARITDAQKELFDARFKHSMHQLDDTDKLRRLRHRIAQMKTVLAEKSGKVQLRKTAPAVKTEHAAKPAKAPKTPPANEPVAEAAPETSPKKATKAKPATAAKATATDGEKKTKATGTTKKKSTES